VLALYSKPSFNPNSWSGRLSSLEKMRNDNDPFKPMLDKTVRPYFPGSVYKIVGSYAALDQGLAEPDDETHCPGYYVYGGRSFRCWKWGGHGDVDLAEALQHSCDVYFYKVAEEAGIDTLAEYAFKFGFGEKTGIPHNNESRGRVPTRKWHEKRSPNGYQHGFALNTVLGQGDTMATPLQVGLAYAAIANGGTIHYPRIVRQVQNGEGDVLYDFPSKVRKRVGLDDEQLRVIRKGLKQAVNTEGGTAYRVKLDDLAISGKTGTAQVHSIGRVRVPNRDKLFQLRDHAWFASYAPSEDPEIALVVFLEHAGHGGRQAAPVAAEVIRKYFDRDAKRSLAKKVDQQVRGGETDE
jgi:penicillin-binding protein 2